MIFEFRATKKLGKLIFSPPLFVVVVGSGIRDPRSWIWD
jgi:hypothetical protein